MKSKVQKKLTVNNKIKKPIDTKNGKIMKNKKIGNLFVAKKVADQEFENEENIIDNTNEFANDIDEEEEEDEDNETPVVNKVAVKITTKTLKQWEQELQTDKSSKIIKKLMDAFHVVAINILKSKKVSNLPYKIENSQVFNGIIELCIQHIPGVLKKFLHIVHDAKFEASKAKRFPKIKNTLSIYYTDIINILQTVTSPDVLTILLKHLHCTIQCTQSFPALNEALFSVLIKLWSSDEEVVRVNAFMNIIKITTTYKEAILDNLLKAMYSKYNEIAKNMTPDNFDCINFMQQSLAEIYLLDHNLAYNHAFMEIRQLALKLRNATIQKNKENIDAVYSWEYLNSIRLWSELIKNTKKQSVIRSLLYPLVQIVTSLIKLTPTSEYYPLRFHCCQLLINISQKTGTFIPVLPYLLEILKFYDFNKVKNVIVAEKMSFTCMLKVTKTQMQENAFKNSIIDNVYQLILEVATKDSNAIYFPDMYINCIMELKSFLAKCQVPSYCKKIKQIYDKIQENRQFVETERNKIIVDLSDSATILNWELTLKTRGTPLQKFYDTVSNQKINK
ncbi:hypothetical protein HCN44_003853 [Aphidius gifuensis]|uniref:Nucleolar complex protein 2 homolog n=1 Tax=Aphidius gifuensis TaxID=684658 RepID=A0A834Y0P0_APHGI|nr:nucleolar complex protein 2 homolog [Aphidius gifuensis]KAF7994381.1 hypothetical protein HCN44_003853 [Aphidius gifuensis]